MDLENEKVKISKILERKIILENNITEDNNIFPYFKKNKKKNGYFEEKIINGDPYSIIAESQSDNLGLKISIATKFPQFDIEELTFTDIFFVIENTTDRIRPHLKKEGFSELYIVKRENKDVLFLYTTMDDKIVEGKYSFYSKNIYVYTIYAKKSFIEGFDDDFDDDRSIEDFLTEYIF